MALAQKLTEMAKPGGVILGVRMLRTKGIATCMQCKAKISVESIGGNQNAKETVSPTGA